MSMRFGATAVSESARLIRCLKLCAIISMLDEKLIYHSTTDSQTLRSFGRLYQNRNLDYPVSRCDDSIVKHRSKEHG
jgi:hypothetical protein